MIKINKDFISIVLLGFLCLVFLYPLLFQQKMFITQDWGRGDLTHFNYPLHHLYGSALKNFSIPFNTNEIYSGFPLLAEGQTGIFYLPNILLFFFLPNFEAYAWSFFVVLFFSAIGTYIYCRLIKLSYVSSFYGAITYAFSMFIACHFVHLNMIQAFSLLPFFFILMRLLVLRKNLVLLYISIALLESQLLFTGHPQIALYSSSASLIYVALFSPRNSRIKYLLFVVGAIVTGGFLSAIQILPTWELSKISPSSELESAQNSMTLFPYTLRDLLYFLHPAPFGDPSSASYTILLKDGIFWENNTHSGIVSFILFVIAIATSIRKKISSYAILFLIFILFSMGWLYVFYYIPPFSLFRLPQRGLIVALFFFAVISAYGLSYIQQKFTFKKTIIASVIAAIILTQFVGQMVLSNTYNNSLSKNEWLELPPTAKFLQDKTERFYSIGGVQLWEKVYAQTGQGWRGEGGQKILHTNNLLDPNRNATYGDIPTIDGYAKLVPLRTLAYLSLTRRGIVEEKDTISISTQSSQLLGNTNTKYILTAKKVEAGGLREVFSYHNLAIDTTFRIYENSFVKSKIRPIAKVEMLPNDRAVEVEDLTKKDSTAFAEYENLTGTYTPDVVIRPNKYSSDLISFTTQSTLPSVILISQSYDENWKATVDGRREGIFALNINSLGIKLNPGVHTIELRYVPQSFYNGLLISGFGLIILITVSVAISYYERTRKPF